MDGGVDAVPAGEFQGGAGREVRAVEGHLGDVRARAGDAQFVRRGDRHLVVQADREEDVGQVVEAVGACAADRELDVDLGRDAYRHRLRHGWVDSSFSVALSGLSVALSAFSGR